MENVLLAAADYCMTMDEEDLDNNKLSMIVNSTVTIIESFSSIIRLTLPIQDPMKIGNLGSKAKDLVVESLTSILYEVGILCFLNAVDPSQFDDGYLEEFIAEFDDLTANDVTLASMMGIQYSTYVNDCQYEEIPLEEELTAEPMSAEDAEKRFDPGDIYSEAPESEVTDIESHLATILSCLLIIAKRMNIDMIYVKQRCIKRFNTDE